MRFDVPIGFGEGLPDSVEIGLAVRCARRVVWPTAAVAVNRTAAMAAAESANV